MQLSTEVVSRMPATPVAPKPELYRDLHLTVDFDRCQVSLDSRQLVLTRKEYELLAKLVEHAGEIVSRDRLLLDVWGYSREIRTRTLDVHVRRLRRKLASRSEHYIETIFGIGYRFQPIRQASRLQLSVA